MSPCDRVSSVLLCIDLGYFNTSSVATQAGYFHTRPHALRTVNRSVRREWHLSGVVGVCALR